MSKLMIVIMAVIGLLLFTGLVYAAGQLGHGSMMMNHGSTECTNADMNQNGDMTQCSMMGGSSSNDACSMEKGTNSSMMSNCPMNHGASAPAEKSSSCH